MLAKFQHSVDGARKPSRFERVAQANWQGPSLLTLNTYMDVVLRLLGLACIFIGLREGVERLKVINLHGLDRTVSLMERKHSGCEKHGRGVLSAETR